MDYTLVQNTYICKIIILSINSFLVTVCSWRFLICNGQNLILRTNLNACEKQLKFVLDQLWAKIVRWTIE